MHDYERTQPFKNIVSVMEIIHGLPMSTASCERGCSFIKRVKIDWRATLNTTDTLSMLMYLSTEEQTPEECIALVVVQRWQEDCTRSRRLVE